MKTRPGSLTWWREKLSQRRLREEWGDGGHQVWTTLEVYCCEGKKRGRVTAEKEIELIHTQAACRERKCFAKEEENCRTTTMQGLGAGRQSTKKQAGLCGNRHPSPDHPVRPSEVMER